MDRGAEPCGECLQTGDATEEQAALARAQMGLPPPSMPAAVAAPVSTQFLQISGMVTGDVLGDAEEYDEVRLPGLAPLARVICMPACGGLWGWLEPAWSQRATCACRVPSWSLVCSVMAARVLMCQLEMAGQP